MRIINSLKKTIIVAIIHTALNNKYNQYSLASITRSFMAGLDTRVFTAGQRFAARQTARELVL